MKEILQIPLKSFANSGDKILIIDEQFIIGENELTSNMILILENDSLIKLFNKLGVQI